MDQNDALAHCITHTGRSIPVKPYHGKVRDVYVLNENTLGIIVTDRISAFDHIMRQSIPFKGQILNQLAAFSFERVKDIVPTHVIDIPHPNLTIAKKCDPIPIEIVIRGYLTGHAWRVYREGGRELCGVRLPDGLKEHQKLSEPILTPATKATSGHDEDISEKEILDQKIINPKLWQQIRDVAFQLFQRGTELSDEKGLILVDTKYEMGLFEGELTLIDEVHTSDSSRYFYKEGYQRRFEAGEPQRQLSKEFLREWLMDKGFQGLEGQILPDLPDSFRWSIYQRYAELFQILTGEVFEPTMISDIDKEIKPIFSQYL